MAENDEKTPAGAAADKNTVGGAGGDQPEVRVMAQYIKDFSFENPNAPVTFEMNQTGKPAIDVSVNVGVRKMNDEIYEAELKLKVTGTSKQDDGQEMTVYIAELAYAGLIGVRNLADDQLKAYMLIGAPTLLFPFARRIIADATRDGGYMPLYLEPINFEALYRQQQAQGGVEAGSSAAAPQPINLN